MQQVPITKPGTIVLFPKGVFPTPLEVIYLEYQKKKKKGSQRSLGTAISTGFWPLWLRYQKGSSLQAVAIKGEGQGQEGAWPCPLEEGLA